MCIRDRVCTTLSGSPLGKELELTPFHSGAALAAALRSGARFALLILDIELDTVDGVAIGRLLREELRDSVTQLLYISGQQQYAMAPVSYTHLPGIGGLTDPQYLCHFRLGQIMILPQFRQSRVHKHHR